MRRLKVAEDARCDIDAVFLHGVREYGLSNADAYVTGLRDVFAFVAEHPFAVRERTEV
jgi:plasmid stabilization system protein ParE